MTPVRAVLKPPMRQITADPVDEDACAASGHFDELLGEIHAPRPAGMDEIGRLAALLASDAVAPMRGAVVHADNGFHRRCGPAISSAPPKCR